MKLLLVSALAMALSAGGAMAADLRLGIVGTDTSHAPAFASILNDPNNKNHIPGARIVAAYKGGSPDLPSSRDRVEKYAEELKTKWGVEIVPDIATLMTKVDAVLLESVDGRPHLAQFKEIAKAGKPVFIDKPLASTLRDALEIARIGKEKNVKWFSASSLRYGDGMPGLKMPGMTGAVTWGPSPLEATHELDLSWYGIHAVEMLYTLMGPGCEEVSRMFGPEGEVVSGRWKDGRVGAVRLNRPYSQFGAVTFSQKETRLAGKEISTGYQGLLREIVKFFQTGVAPVEEQETLEMFKFMEAARLSKERGGAVVRLP